MEYFKHETADVSEKAEIGSGTKIWNYAQIREGVKIGADCILGKNVYIDSNVRIGNKCKIQNNVSVFHGVTIEDGVFVGPHVCFTNDKNPRAIDESGNLKSADDWDVSEISVGYGVAIGANSTILPGVSIGEFALIGAGSVVTKDVASYNMVFGNPARVHGIVDKAGKLVKKTD
ncbi:MAG: acyltransferase [Candidatus Berkelbacteria bacterium]